MPGSRATIRLDATELLNFLCDWFDSRDAAPLANSLHRFVADPAYNLTEPQADTRFAFLLGDDGERLLGVDQH